MTKTVKFRAGRNGAIGSLVEIELPITANPHRLRTVPASIMGLAMAMFALSSLSAFPTALAAPSLTEKFFALAPIVLLVALGATLGSTMLTAIRDLALAQPVVQIDEEGIFDRRVLDRVIRWDEIASVTSYRIVNGGLLLHLKEPLPVRFNLLRIGTIFHFWQPQPQTAYISMNWLIGPFFPVGAVFALASENQVSLFERRRLGNIVPITIIPPDAFND